METPELLLGGGVWGILGKLWVLKERLSVGGVDRLIKWPRGLPSRGPLSEQL